MSSTIKTAIRIRPFLHNEVKEGYRNTKLEVATTYKQLLIRDENNNTKCFSFDYLFNYQQSQEDVYTGCGVDEMLQKALEGYHSTIFAYGQTGSGKTFTMQGDYSLSHLDGIIPKLVTNLFKKIYQSSAVRTYSVFVSFLQIYNERIYDLLNPSSLNNRNVGSSNVEGLRLRWSKDEQFTVENMFVFECKCEYYLMKYFILGNKNRIQASHKLNVQSSRSHSIMTIRVDSVYRHNPSSILSSKIELVDLAGSERLSVTGAEGRQAKYSIDINKSLFTLRQVISILAEKSNRTKKDDRQYVPYRDSKLTSLLKQSIGGNSYSLMIACITPNDAFIEENFSTIAYATKASHITNRPIVNDDPRTRAVNYLKLQIKQLTSELDKANQHIELLSGINGESTKNTQGDSPLKMTPREPIRSSVLCPYDNEVPVPVFKKRLQYKIQNNYYNVSERLIESINMVRELLKSNKELRERLECTTRLCDYKDLYILELMRENDMLKYQTERPEDAEKRALLGSIQGRRTVTKHFKEEKSLNPMHFSQKNKIANGRSLDIRTTPTDARISNDYRGQNGNTDVSNMYMLEKGADSAPTNFNKRDISTSHEQRVAYSRGKVTIAEQERHAITAKLNKRGWLGKHPYPKKFLSFYEDPRS